MIVIAQRKERPVVDANVGGQLIPVYRDIEDIDLNIVSTYSNHFITSIIGRKLCMSP